MVVLTHEISPDSRDRAELARGRRCANLFKGAGYFDEGLFLHLFNQNALADRCEQRPIEDLGAENPFHSAYNLWVGDVDKLAQY